jgi:hypothetical protein
MIRSAARSSLGLAPTAMEAAAAEVHQLVDELEPTLDDRQRRLLHRLRLAAESLGAIRAAANALSSERPLA